MIMTKKSANCILTNEEKEQIIIETIKTQKPETNQQLINVLQEKISMTPEEIIETLTQLKNQNKIRFGKREEIFIATLSSYVFSRKAEWYWITIALSLATVLAMFTIPDAAYPLIYFRMMLGIVFVLFIPGYSLTKVLFPLKLPMLTSSEEMDKVERFILNIGLSIALVPIVMLLLNFSPWGIKIASITLSLTCLTCVLATTAILHEYEQR